jgi:3-deoxy-D-manno-octulosonic-acid transferase
MFIYRLLLTLLSPIILGHIVWLAISNRQIRYFWQRLGFKYSNLPKNSLWFHCASVGEVNTLLPLLKNIHNKNNQLNMLITTNTITGAKVVKQQNLDYLYHSYLPFDWCYAIRSFIAATRPASLYIMETEIWPNLFSLCDDNKIPLHIINARLSSKTTTANKWVKSLLKHSLSKVDAIYARSEENALAYQKLGASTDIIKNTGNLKFSTAIHSSQDSQNNKIPADRHYVLLASSHQDEEKKIYTIWSQLKRSELLVIAPRHPERCSSIVQQLESKNIAIRSKDQPITDTTEIFLLDTVGELKNYFTKAKFVIMGGSFVPVGGHNILEPAGFNKAIVTGPSMEPLWKTTRQD